MDLFSPRLPHVVTRGDLVELLVPTYAAAHQIDRDEARDRLVQALNAPALVAELYRGLSLGLHDAKGPRTQADTLIDRLARGVLERRDRVRAAPDSPGLAAVMVRINLEIGLAPEPMRATLQSDRGRAALDDGLRALGAHLVRQLAR